ncbi:hypothetical protein [Burkholderia ubonensis]|uniref:hypothetical protein n=1 Tax=Burkholderia ubonensis TaxID=101571 RepID=UPI00075B5220|nr:hypothetical protein [Burkholderia ubonensis]KVZ76382.1 hypothetical protein WL22_08840 [Burkholderia ubonensis]KWE15855.1 hypothetical protein WL75_19990 [Burkholderia ubonensis]
MSNTEHADCPYFLHTSLPVYAMVHKPIDAPSIPAGSHYCGDMQLLCQKAHGERFISTYLSPLDAVMGSRGILRGGHFWPIDFQHVDTRTFMEQNGGLNISINYAYAADDDRLVVDERGHPLMVFTSDSFNVPPKMWEHFSIVFSDNVVEEINDAYARAGLPKFSDTLDDMRTWTAEQIADAEGEALSRIPPIVSIRDVRNLAMSQGAIYDPESGDWMFVNFEQRENLA